MWNFGGTFLSIFPGKEVKICTTFFTASKDICQLNFTLGTIWHNNLEDRGVAAIFCGLP